MLLASKLPMGFYRSYALHFLLLTLVLLMLVPVIGVKANGSRRWLGSRRARRSSRRSLQSLR